MALNLGERLRDAVDGPVPGLDEVVGEDPAGFDLPALSARIRRRRRARAVTRSAVGVAAAGAVVLAGANGLGGRGAGTVQAPLTAGRTELCGQDAAAMPAIDGDVRLVPASSAVVGDDFAADVTDLGAFAGRTLTAALLESQDVTTAGFGDIALTRGGVIVAVGAAQPRATSFTIDRQGAGSTAGASSSVAVSVVSAELAPCPTPDGTPSSVPPGTYAVQFVAPFTTSDPTTGAVTSLVVRRAAAGPWSVALLDQPAAAALPDGYPADQVPVVGGTVLSATSSDAAGSRWTVRVAVDGDDGVTRAVTALRAAGAVVTEPGRSVVVASDSATTPDATDRYQESGDGDVLHSLQAELSTAAGEVATAQGLYDELLAAQADPDATDQAARLLQAAEARLSALQANRAALEASATTEQDTGVVSYTVLGPTSFEAATHDWSVTVTQSAGSGGSGSAVLTYVLTRS